MKQKKYTKRALCMSVLSLLLCCSMLVGTTFAWFTDSVTSGKNQIVAGNLDVELEYAPAGTEMTDGKIADTAWQKVTADVNLFKPAEGDGATLWEPGHTEYVYLRVRNAGSLALKYSLTANAFGGDDGETPEKEYTSVETDASGEHTKFKLSEYLVFRAVEGTEAYTDRSELWLTDPAEEAAAMGKLDGIGTTGEVLYPAAKADADHVSERIFTLAVYMPTSVGNAANQLTSAKATEGEPAVYLGLTLNATQTPYEEDSFDENYDAVLSLTGTALVGALSSSTEKEAAFGEDIHLGQDGIPSNLEINGDKEIDLNGHTVFGPDGSGNGLEVDGHTVSFANGTFQQVGSLDCIQVYPGSTVTFENMSFVSKNTETYHGAAVKITAESDDDGAKTTVVFNGCTFDGTIPSFSGNSSEPLELDVQFIGCTFVNSKAAYSTDCCLTFQKDVWGTVLVDGCTINYDTNDSYGSAIWIMGDDSTHQLTLTMKNSTVNITKGNHLRKGSNAEFVDAGGNTYQVNGVDGTIKNY